MRKIRSFSSVRVLLFLLIFLFLAVYAEGSSDYPGKSNINAIVGFSPGGPTDVIGRGILPILQEKLGTGIAITNMPGAAGATAAFHVLRQPKDGYTLYFGSEIMSIWQTMGTADLSPVRDFIPIKLVAMATPVLAVPPSSKFKSAQEFISYAKKHPKELRIGTAGPGTVPHISGLILSQVLGTDFTFVPYQGGRPAVTAVMGAQVDATIEMVQSMVEAYKGGKLNILASFTNDPIPGHKEIPAIGKLYPGLRKYLPYGPYFGLFAPKGVSQEVVNILAENMDKAIQDPKWINYCKNLLLTPIDYDGEAAIEFLNKWTSKSAWILYDAGGSEHSPEEFNIPRAK